jgi:succinyl-diaminopimelate desuccinylase
MSDQKNPTLDLASKLIRCNSVSPDDAGCQDIIIRHLETLDFEIHRLPYADVDNFWAITGEGGPILCFAGHTDVVPAGDPATWQTEPFNPTIKGDLLYGRGAADMKGSLAAMVTATESFLQQYPDHRGSIAFLITSDEEGSAINGTTRVVDWLASKSINPDWCIIGEPSSSVTLGDTIRIGRRGSLNGNLTVTGTQGHVAYPQLADNPIHKLAPVLAELTGLTWDEGNKHFPPTSFQISNIHAGLGAANVIPGEIVVDFNFRFSTEVSAPQLQDRVDSLLIKAGLTYKLNWRLSGNPFLTKPGRLVKAVSDSILECAKIVPELSTGGGTSDGRFIAALDTEIVELGAVNSTIHKVDEYIAIADLDMLGRIYRQVLCRLLCD